MMKKFLVGLCIILSSVLCSRVEFPIGGNLAPDTDLVYVDGMLGCANIQGLPYSSTEFPHQWHDAEEFLVQVFSYNVVQPESAGVWSIVIENADFDTFLSPYGGAFINSTYDNQTRRFIAKFQVDVNLGFIVQNYRSPAANRSIKAIRPGYPIDGHQRFTNWFLNLLKNLNTLRTMDWLVTNNYDAVANWSDRYTLDSPTYCRVPYEIIIELANAAQKNLWLNVPVSATDDYVHNLAQLFEEQLDPHLILYVEFGNELWNFMFIGWPIHFNLANAEPYATILNFENSSSPNQYEIGARWNGYRQGEIALMFRERFGRDAMNTRVRMLLGTEWGADEALSPQLVTLLHFEEKFGKVNDLIFGCAGAPYIGSGPFDTVDEYLDDLNKTIQTYWSSQSTQLDQCRALGLQFVQYEGGPGMTGSFEILQALYLDPRAVPIMTEYYLSFFRAGYGLFNDYAIGTWGYMWPFMSYWDPNIPTMVQKSMDIVAEQAIIEPNGKTTYVALPGRWDYPRGWFNMNNAVLFPPNVYQIWNPHNTDVVYNFTTSVYIRLDWINHLNLQICVDGQYNCTDGVVLEGTDWYTVSWEITIPRGQHWLLYSSDDLFINWAIKYWVMEESQILKTDSYRQVKWNYDNGDIVRPTTSNSATQVSSNGSLLMASWVIFALLFIMY